MITPELITFIRKERSLGVSEDGYTKALFTQGWNAKDVAEAQSEIAHQDRMRAAAPVSNPSTGATVQPFIRPVSDTKAEPQNSSLSRSIPIQTKPQTPISLGDSPLSAAQPQTTFAPRIINPMPASAPSAPKSSYSSSVAPADFSTAQTPTLPPTPAPAPVIAQPAPVLVATPLAQEHFIPTQPVVALPTARVPSKKPLGLILLLILLIAGGGGYYYWHTEIAPQQSAALSPAASFANTVSSSNSGTDVLPSGSVTTGTAPTASTTTTPSATTPAANAALVAGAITLTSPLNGQTISGSALTVKYTLATDVAQGEILFGSATDTPQNACTHFITNEKAGTHSYSCTLPNQIGNMPVSLLQVSIAAGTPSSQIQGQVVLGVPTGVTVKDIQYAPATVLIPASAIAAAQGALAFSVLYSDGVKRAVDVSDFTFSIADASVVSIFGTPAGATLYLHGLQAGTTMLAATYQGVTKDISVTVY